MSSPSRSHELSAEASVLAPLLRTWLDMHSAGAILASDFAGAFILAYASLRRPRRWLGGVLASATEEYLGYFTTEAIGTRIQELPGLIELLDAEYLKKKLRLETVCSITIPYLLCRHSLYGIKKNTDNYISTCMLGWYLHRRPFELLLYIPTPLQVLAMQAQGRRVVTVLVKEEELSAYHVDNLTYMEGGRSHHKDCFEFALHDLKHMENFLHPATHQEQVGFFRCMLQLEPGAHPKVFFRSLGFDGSLWLQLEYLVADMNCYSTHLLRYLLAKLVLAVKRDPKYCMAGDSKEEEHAMSEEGSVRLRSVWTCVLTRFGLTERSHADAYAAAASLVGVALGSRKPLDADEWEFVRDFFKSVVA